MASSLRTLVAKIIKIGSLTVRGPLGEETFGRGGGRNVTIRFTDAKAEEELAADPALKLVSFTWRAGSSSTKEISTSSWRW